MQIWYDLVNILLLLRLKFDLIKGQILEQNSMLRMQEIAFPGFKFQKFSGVACPQTPLEFVVPPNFRIMLQSDFKLDRPLSSSILCVNYCRTLTRHEYFEVVNCIATM